MHNEDVKRLEERAVHLCTVHSSSVTPCAPLLAPPELGRVSVARGA